MSEPQSTATWRFSDCYSAVENSLFWADDVADIADRRFDGTSASQDVACTLDIIRAVKVRLALRRAARKPGQPLTYLHIHTGVRILPAADRRGADWPAWQSTRLQTRIREGFRSAAVGTGNLRPDLYVTAEYMPDRKKRQGVSSQTVSLTGGDGHVFINKSNKFPTRYYLVPPEWMQWGRRRPNGDEERDEGMSTFTQAKKSVWSAKLPRAIAYALTAFERFGTRFGLLRVHDQWCRLFAIDDCTIAIECASDYLSLHDASFEARVAAASQFLDDQENSTHLPCSWTEDPSSAEPYYRHLWQSVNVLLQLELTYPLRSLAESPLFDSAQTVEQDPSLHENTKRALLQVLDPGNGDAQGECRCAFGTRTTSPAPTCTCWEVSLSPPVLPSQVERDAEGSVPEGDGLFELGSGFVGAARPRTMSAGLTEADFLNLAAVKSDARIQATLAPLERSESYEASSCGDLDLTEEKLEKQTRILRDLFDDFGIRLVLVSPADMDALVRIVSPAPA